MSKTYDNVKDAKEALKKAPSGSMILAKGKPGNETFKIIQIGPGPGGTITKKADGGMMKKNLKPVDKEKNPGLAKLPTEVRNKMGYMKDGGDVTNMPPSQRRIAEKLKNFIEKNGRTPSTDAEIDSVYGKGAVDKEMKRLGAKKMKDGGMVLEIGLRPATAKENKMAKKMMGKKPKKMAGGGMVSRGTGAAIRGKKFKGVF